jgi:hypothetical protein
MYMYICIFLLYVLHVQTNCVRYLRCFLSFFFGGQLFLNWEFHKYFHAFSQDKYTVNDIKFNRDTSKSE